MNRKKTAVIGGGVSGITAAIRAASNGNIVTIYEHTDSLGKKLLITGNGKCNFSNQDTGLSHYHSSSDKGHIAGVFSRFSKDMTVDFFEGLGLCIKEKEGRLYPCTDSSRTVLTLLKLELKRLGVEIRLNSHIKDIDDENAIDGIKYDTIILASGGCTHEKTGSDGSGFKIAEKLGIKLIRPLPALTSIPVKEDVSSLKGVRCRAGLKLYIDGEYAYCSEGELQPYEKGLSGICAMDLSGEACRAVFGGQTAKIECDLFPRWNNEELISFVERMQKNHPERNLKECLSGLFTEKLLNFLIHPVDTRKPDWMQDLVNSIKGTRFTVTKDITGEFANAQVTSGGVPFDQVDKDLKLITRPDIRICGEMLDVYGDCGGYNLQWAISSGFCAGDIR